MSWRIARWAGSSREVLNLAPISVRVAAETRNEAASTHSTWWTGARVMSRPASRGPAIWAAE